MDGDGVPSDRLNRRTRLEAGLAVLPVAAVAAAWLWINAPHVAGVFLMCVMLLAVPLSAGTRRSFVTASLVIAGVFVALSALGVFFGLFLLFPSAIILATGAGLAARRIWARTIARVATWLVASSVLAGFGLALHHHFFPRSDIIIVQESGPDTHSARLNSLSHAIWKAGFTSVSVGTWTSTRQLAVDAPGLPELRRQHLLALVRAQPGVVTAYWCQGAQCDG